MACLSHSLSQDQLEAVCERAAHYRRQVVAGGAGILPNMLENIRGEPTRPIPGAAGWLLVGHVFDGRADERLAIWWHRPTDRVKLARP